MTTINESRTLISNEFVRARSEGSTELSFTDMSINNVICQQIISFIAAHFANITRLDLSENEISVIPAEIGRLQNLVVLNLAVNNLDAVPDEVGQLNELEALDLSNNEDITELPRVIGRLESLHQLDLEYTGITEIPGDNAEQLREFDFCNLPDGVELPEIPSTLSVASDDDQVVPSQ